MISKNAEWIWINEAPQKNEYAFFEGSFDFCGKDRCKFAYGVGMELYCKTTYICYLLDYTYVY